MRLVFVPSWPTQTQGSVLCTLPCAVSSCPSGQGSWRLPFTAPNPEQNPCHHFMLRGGGTSSKAPPQGHSQAYPSVACLLKILHAFSISCCSLPTLSLLKELTLKAVSGGAEKKWQLCAPCSGFQWCAQGRPGPSLPCPPGRLYPPLLRRWRPISLHGMHHRGV